MTSFLATLLRLRDLGNSVLVVEHDEDTMRAADYIVDIGPAPGAWRNRRSSHTRLPEMTAESAEA